MNLRTLSMLPDDIGPLGPPIRREQTKPAPAPTVENRPDGTLTTHPDGSMSFEPKVAETQPVPVWPFPHAPKPAEPEEPGAHGFMREPLKVGDLVRVLGGGGIPDEEKGVHVIVEIDSYYIVVQTYEIGRWRGGEWVLDARREGTVWERIQ